MSLLPSRPDISTDDSDPRVIGVESDDAEDVLAALSSETARSLLAALHEEPGSPAELADRVDTSVQNVQYHLDKLADAGAIEVADTAYSAKGREMDVYAPADQPLVIFAGDSQDQSTLRTALSRLLGAFGVLGVASLVVQALASRGGLTASPDGATAPTAATPEGADGGDGGDAADAPGESTEEAAISEDTLEAQDAGTDTPSGDAVVADADSTPTPEGTPDLNETISPTETPDVTPTPESLPTPDATPTPEPQTAVDAAAGLPPGLLFFAGGAFVLVVVVILFSSR